jgi:hypothetical protein
MSSPNNPSKDHFDNLISQSLKNWLWQQNPPEDSKERLLSAITAESSREQSDQKFWRLIPQILVYRINALFFPNNIGYVQYPQLAHEKFFNTNFQRGIAYHLIIHSIPSGRGILCF